MAFGHFMNMEKLSLSIVDQHIEYMTNDNYTGTCFIDIDNLVNNIQNGFVIITQLNCFLESFLNTILDACMNYTGEVLLKCSTEEKLDIIFMHYQKDLSSVKSDNSWSIYKKTTRVRNEMIHYKKTYIGEGTGIPDFELGKEKVTEFFTYHNMVELRKGYEKLTDIISNTLGLQIYKDIQIFEVDGRDGLVNYVYDNNRTVVDETRFENH